MRNEYQLDKESYLQKLKTQTFEKYISKHIGDGSLGLADNI